MSGQTGRRRKGELRPGQRFRPVSESQGSGHDGQRRRVDPAPLILEHSSAVVTARPSFSASKVKAALSCLVLRGLRDWDSPKVSCAGADVDSKQIATLYKVRYMLVGDFETRSELLNGKHRRFIFPFWSWGAQ